jgi:uncharacterized membrane protein YgcG
MLTIVPLAHAVKTAVVVGYLYNQSQTPPTDSTSGRKLLTILPVAHGMCFPISHQPCSPLGRGRWKQGVHESIHRHMDTVLLTHRNPHSSPRSALSCAMWATLSVVHAVKTAVVVGYLLNATAPIPTPEETDSTSGRKLLTVIPVAHALKTAVVVGYVLNQTSPPAEETTTSGRRLLTVVPVAHALKTAWWLNHADSTYKWWMRRTGGGGGGRTGGGGGGRSGGGGGGDGGDGGGELLAAHSWSLTPTC